MPSLYVRYYKMLAATYFGPRRNEKIFPSLFLGLIQNSPRSSIVVGKNGSEPTIGSEGIAGGNLRPLSLTLCRRQRKYVVRNTAPNTSNCCTENSVMQVKIDAIFSLLFVSQCYKNRPELRIHTNNRIDELHPLCLLVVADYNTTTTFCWLNFTAVIHYTTIIKQLT